MLTVYRIQDSEGRGPWRPGFSHFWVRDRDDHDNLKPWPAEFGTGIMRGTSGHIGCACRTIEHLRRWFQPDEYVTLLLYGYQCVRLDVDRVLAESSTQLVFERKRALRFGAASVSLYAREEA